MSIRSRRRPIVPPPIRAGAFPAELEARAMALRADGSAIGAFLADEVVRIAEVARFLGAGSPAEFVDRRDVEEAMLREHWYELGKDHQRQQDADDASERRAFGPLGAPMGDSPPRYAGLGIHLPDDGHP